MGRWQEWYLMVAVMYRDRDGLAAELDRLPGGKMPGSSRNTCWPSTNCNSTAARSRPAPRRAERLGPGTSAREAYIAPALKPDGSANPTGSLVPTGTLNAASSRCREQSARSTYKDLRPRRAARIGRSQLPRPPHPRRRAAREVRAGHPRHRATVGIHIRRRVQDLAYTCARARRHSHRGDPPGGRAGPKADRPPAC